MYSETTDGVYDTYFASVAIASAKLNVTSDAAPASLNQGFLDLCPTNEAAAE